MSVHVFVTGETVTAAVLNTALPDTPLVYLDNGIATSSAADIATTAVRTITDPFGAGVPYRVRASYQLGLVTAAAGVNGRVQISVNGTPFRYGVVSPLSSAAPSAVVDVPGGGTTTVQAALVAKSATMATFLDATSHILICEVYPL